MSGAKLSERQVKALARASEAWMGYDRWPAGTLGGTINALETRGLVEHRVASLEGGGTRHEWRLTGKGVALRASNQE